MKADSTKKNVKKAENDGWQAWHVFLTKGHLKMC